MSSADPHEVRATARWPGRESLFGGAIALLVAALLVAAIAALPVPDPGPNTYRYDPSNAQRWAAVHRLRIGVRLAGWGAAGLGVLSFVTLGLWVVRRPVDIVLTPYQLRIDGRVLWWEEVAFGGWRAKMPCVVLRDGEQVGVGWHRRLSAADIERLCEATDVALARIEGAAPLDEAARAAVAQIARTRLPEGSPTVTIPQKTS